MQRASEHITEDAVTQDAVPQDAVGEDAVSGDAIPDSAIVDGAAPAPQRADGTVALAVGGAPTRLRRLRASGSAKCLFPRRRDGQVEAVLLNTAGGLADGDRFAFDIDAQPGARLVVTTQAAERVYRAHGADAARLDVRLRAGAGARLDWLPQETILFDGGRIRRRLRADLAEDAALLAVETIVLGRRAMGEAVRSGLFFDRREVYRQGRRLHTDATRLAGAIEAQSAGAAAFGGAVAAATLLRIGPEPADAAEAIRATLADARDGAVTGGASAWGDVCLARWLGRDAAALKRALSAALQAVRGAPPPLVWAI